MDPEDEERAIMRKADQAAYECLSTLSPASCAILEAFAKADYSPAVIEDILRPLWKEEPFFRFVRPAAEFLEYKSLQELRHMAQDHFNNLPMMAGGK